MRKSAGRKNGLGIVVIGLAFVVAFSVLGMPVAAQPDPSATVGAARPEPTREALACSWKLVGSSTRDVLHAAAAFDEAGQRLYVYGGLDEAFRVQKLVEAVDVSGPILAATHLPVAAGGALPLAGAAGAFRAKGADSDLSGAYFFGGMGDAAKGQAGNFVQRYLVRPGRWERVVPANDQLLGARMFAAAAYDSAHDVIWVVGGIGQCVLTDVAAGAACTARSLETVYLSFDAQDRATWNVLPGGALALYGHTAVYDPVGKRLLVVGGTSNGTAASSVVRALDLSHPNPAMATWSVLNTVGPTPAVYFHGAVLDTEYRWLIVYGGVRSAFLRPDESVNSVTSYLDLRASPPVWADLRPSGNPGDRIASAMGFDRQRGIALITLGRSKIAFAGSPPQPQPDVARTTWALECSAALPTPSPTPPYAGSEEPKACPNVSRYVPAAVIANALANPTTIQGWGQLCFPSQPPSPYNVRRTWLVLDRPVAFHPLYNSVVFECGCR